MKIRFFIDPVTAMPHIYNHDVNYIKVPSKRKLDLGTRLVFSFANQQPEAQSRETVHEIFRSRGAYRRFKGFLYEIKAIDRWYAFEENALRHELQAWGEEYGIEIVG